jgi:hypothetical protein
MNIVVLLLLLLISVYIIQFIVHYVHYFKYPGHIQTLPKFLPKIPFFNAEGFTKFQHSDIILREKNPDLNGYPFLSFSYWWMHRFVVSDANVVKEIFLHSAKEFPKPKDRMELVFGVYGPNILTENGGLRFC